MKLERAALILVVLVTLWATHANACTVVGDVTTDLVISGQMRIAADTCFRARNVTFRLDSKLIANGFSLSSDVIDDLIAERGAVILGFDYDQLTRKSSFPAQIGRHGGTEDYGVENPYGMWKLSLAG